MIRRSRTKSTVFPANPFLQLTPARIPQVLERLRGQLWAPTNQNISLAATPPTAAFMPLSAARKQSLKPITRFPDHYGKLWDQRWFRLRFPPTEKYTWLRWLDESEATLFLDGTPIFGFDVAHHEALLPAGTQEVWVEAIVSQTAIWHPAATGLSPNGSRLDQPALLKRNAQAWELLHDFLVLDDVMRLELSCAFPGRDHEFGAIGTKPPLQVVSPLLRRLLRFLDDAMNALDSEGSEACRRVLKKAFDSLPSGKIEPTGILTGHAHIDLVWLWPERVGERKAVHTFATANHLMDQYPEFCFAYSQPASYEAVARLAPDLMERVTKRMKEKRWEALGATYVESDTILACGEALFRSFLLGQEVFSALTGNRSSILWLPDVFGYSGCLPQLMKETGVESFFTTKLTWNALNAFPYSSFRWIGAEGSEVTAHICQNNGYNQSVLVSELRRGASAHRQCDVHPEFLAPSGFGDGGGGPTAEMCERARRLANLAGCPPTRWDRVGNFFSRLEQLRDQLPAYHGELYFEYHRGTYTTHGQVKAAMRAAERSLQMLEAAACQQGSPPLPPHDWKRVVFAQFHDYIPGSSVHEVYAEALPELAAIEKASLVEASSLLEKKSGLECLFNPLPLPRRLVLDSDEVIDLPPLASVSLAHAVRPHTEPVVTGPGFLRNGRVDARFDALGRIRSLSIDGLEIPFTEPANQLALFADFPHAFEAWDIDRQTLSLGRRDDRRADKEIMFGGRHQGAIIFSRPLGDSSKAVVRYDLEADSPALRITYEIDWQEPNTLLKAAFPTEFMGYHARFGAPFGSALRPQLGGDARAEAMWEVPASRWAVVGDDNQSSGFFIVTEAKYGFSCRDGNLAVSLLRSARLPSEDRGAVRGSHPEPLRRTLAPHLFSDIGPHKIQIAVGAFQPDAPREEHPAALAETLFSPVMAHSGSPRNCGLLGMDGGNSLQPCWAAPKGRGRWTLRLHETLGRSGKILLHLEKGWTAHQVDLSGQPLGTPQTTFSFQPYKVMGLEFVQI